MSNFTEKAIKESFIKLLEEKPLSQITVKQIVEGCGINRNSFYYHFADIPALIESLVMEEAGLIMAQHPTVESLEDALNAVFDFAFEHRRAILHIYKSVNREIFERYLWNVCDHVVNAYGKTLPEQETASQEDKELIGRFYKSACFGLVIEWLEGRMKGDVRSSISRFCQLHHGMVEEMIKRSRE